MTRTNLRGKKNKKNSFMDKCELHIIDSYVMGGVIGCGSYGDVRHGLDTSTSPAQHIAIKVVDLYKLSKVKNGIEAVQNEVQLSQRPGLFDVTKNLVPIHTVLEDSNNHEVYFVMPCCMGTIEMLQHPLPLCSIIHIMHNVGIAVQHLHSLNVAHKDIKPANCFVMENGNVVLGDYGCTEEMIPQRSGKCQRITGTPGYQPPEIARGESTCNGFAWDMWALGVLFYQLLTNTHPFRNEGDSLMEMFHKISECEPSYDAISETSIRNIVQQLLRKNEVERPTIHQFLSVLADARTCALDLTEMGSKYSASRKHFVENVVTDEPLLNSLRHPVFCNVLQSAYRYDCSSCISWKNYFKYYLGSPCT
eukprot:PhF_6_TR8861/c0_g1_i1/m.14028/K07298/STK11, LKB1; serine/threonine-protein kinase 11